MPIGLGIHIGYYSSLYLSIFSLYCSLYIIIEYSFIARLVRLTKIYGITLTSIILICFS